MLEDNDERLAAFAGCVRQLVPPLELLTWRSARRMIDDCAVYLPACRLICLDHDLDPLPADPHDPGDGMDVARFLALQRPVCPIIIHSSNGDGAARMRGELEEAGWNVSTVLPAGARWIEDFWFGRVKGLLR